jgi:hypothetical protein
MCLKLQLDFSYLRLCPAITGVPLICIRMTLNSASLEEEQIRMRASFGFVERMRAVADS